MSRLSQISIKDTSRHNKYKIEDIFVYTPYQIYESQQTFIAYVLSCLKNGENALIQSPTGTGKTMSLLCSTLAWCMDYQQTQKKDPPQIIYASRTHAQLKQVVKELNNLCYKVKISLLSSRDQSCINEDLKYLKGQDKQLQCRLRIAQRKGLSCKFYRSQSFYEKEAELGKLMDLQQLSLKAKLQGFCPFYYERLSRDISNIVFIPYNYLFDKKVWSNEEGIRMQGSIIILDQAHNIQSVCQQYLQYTISLSTLNRALQQMAQLRESKLSQNKKKLDPGQLNKVKMMKVGLQDIEINASYIQLIYEHLQMLDIPAHSNGLQFEARNFSKLLDQATQTSDFGSLSRNIKEMIKGFQSFQADLMFTPFWALQSWMRFIEKISQLITEANQPISQFMIQVAYEGSDIRISIHCLNPSLGFKEVLEQHKPRSIILTSGTLSPLKVWPIQLAVKFAKPVSCPHVLSSQQVNTLVLGVGPSGHQIDTKFQSRKQARLYQDIGNILYDIVRYTPNGVVVLFPSYGFLQQTKVHLTSQRILTKLYQCKNIYMQRKDSSDFASTIDRYMKDAQTQKGALLFALVRGRVSEGLDFSHQKCRAVVMVGVPFPCSKDVKVVSKMSYLDKRIAPQDEKLTGSQWYLAQTVRAINQGIGRLIRTPEDYGTVYLIDTRFTKPDIETQLASWARQSLFKYTQYSQFLKKIKQVNKIKEIPELSAIQAQLGFTSHRGTFVGPVALVAPPKTVKGTISGVPKKTQQQNKQQMAKNLSLPQLLALMKSQKQANLLARDQQSEQENIQQLQKKQQKSKQSYEKRIFGKKVVPLESGIKQICSVCQVQNFMIKSNTCQHSLCKQCWDKWLDQDLRCPICRGRVRKNFLVPQT